MYKSFFKLSSAPFKLTPDTACFFAEGNRKAILEALIYSVSNGDGISKVVGEVGSGKTLLSRLLARSLPSQFEVLYLLNSNISADKILYAIAIELGLSVDYAEDKVRLLHLLHNRLLELHQQNKQTILLVDEAQAMPLETLEEIRMLSNLETEQHKLLQIILFGQPELDQKLNKHKVRQIKERIIHSFYLPPLTNTEVGRYLYFRMQKAGGQGAFPFSNLAIRVITFKSAGFLRRINILADNCLLVAFSKQSKKVGLLIALKATAENKTSNVLAFSAIALAILFTLIVFYSFDIPDSHKTSQLLPVQAQTMQHKVSPTQPLNIKAKELTEAAKIITTEPNKPKPQFNENAYVIQLLRLPLSEKENQQIAIARLIPVKFHKLTYFYPLRDHVYQVFLAQFDSYHQAKNILAQLPPQLKKNKPFIARINKISVDKPITRLF